ncbi:flagellar export protein FliJ [Lichenicola sp.]|uniref:flagellar export protein FliJ n=1 Tax=Lichenicola sp. TaxID=2804529 RepID=UPI003B008267
MKRDPLKTLLRIRQATLDDAQKAVSDAYHAEHEASRLAEEAGEALAHEMRSAMNLGVDDDAVEAFARWLPLGRRAIKQAHEALRDATSRLDQARAILTLARSGVRTVESLDAQRKDERRQEEDRRAQHELDEIGARTADG